MQQDSNSASHLLMAAIGYATVGLPVFPCRGKVPLTPRGCRDASTDLRQVRVWWEKFPDANVAIATGQGAGLFVLDVDTQKLDPKTGQFVSKKGQVSLDALVREHGELPKTATVVTGTGGRHAYFRFFDGLKNSAGVLGDGLDIRAEGGYIMAPPSVHPDTGAAYVWETPFSRATLAEPPLWLVTRLKLERGRGRKASGPESVPRGTERPVIEESDLLLTVADGLAHSASGTRNETLNRAAFRLAASRTVDRDLAHDVLRAAADGCGLVSDDGEEAFEGTFASGWEAGVKAGQVEHIGQFEVSDRGVHWIEPDTEGDRPRKEWVCSRLDVVACTRSIEHDEWGRLLHFADADGHMHEWAMPMSMLAADGATLREILLGKGLKISPSGSARRHLMDYLHSEPPARARATNHIGWHGPSFVLPELAIGVTSERIVFQCDERPDHAFRVAGTLRGWQETIGRWCVGNTRLAFAIAAAFAPPLLTLLGEDGGGFHLRGGSSTGKTTALLAAGSVWGGGGSAGYIQRWRATANGLEAVAEMHNDALLCLDELGQVDPREAGDAAYCLANGGGKARANRSGGARRRASWRVLFLSSGEIGLGDHMEAAGKRVRAGQNIRLADIPMDAGIGLGGWEMLHGADSADAFARQIKDAASVAYGVPIRAFLGWLIEADRSEIIAKAKRYRDRFLETVVSPSSSGEVSRVAGRFAVVAAAGQLAVDAGVLPWPADWAHDATSRCFLAWLERRGTTGAADMDAAIAQVRAFMSIPAKSNTHSGHGEHARSDVTLSGQYPTPSVRLCLLPPAWLAAGRSAA